jgi:hypothetical protein
LLFGEREYFGPETIRDQTPDQVNRLVLVKERPYSRIIAARFSLRGGNSLHLWRPLATTTYQRQNRSVEHEQHN